MAPRQEQQATQPCEEMLIGRFDLIALLLTSSVIAQYSNNFAYEWKSAENCTENEVFNPVVFKCKSCENNQIANRRHNRCVCRPSSRTVVDRQQTQCVPCANDQGSRLAGDVSVCIDCINDSGDKVAANGNGTCPPCSPNSVSTYYTTLENGSIVGREVCAVCAENTELNSQKTACVPCKSRECLCAKNSTLCKDSAQTSLSFVIETDNDRSFFSPLIEKSVIEKAADCQLYNQEACQSLANLCVLQNYNRDQNTACMLLESLRNNQNFDLIPSIIYTNTEASVELFRESAIDAVFNVEKGSQNVELDFQLAIYHFNGSFLGMHSVKTGLLQICPAKLKTLQEAFEFGRFYAQSCRLTVFEAVTKIQEIQSRFNTPEATMFYELYIRYTTHAGQQMIYNVPVLNELIRLRGEQVNKQNSDSHWILTRRFFLFDKQLNDQKTTELLRLHTHISFQIQLQPSRDGRIFPPYFRIRYNEYYNELDQSLHLLGQNEETAEFQFKIGYVIDTFRHDKTIEVLMATFCSCCVLLGAFKAYSWSRRAGKLMVDLATVLTFVLNTMDSIGNVFLMVMSCASVWITFAYKFQKHMVYVPLAYEQEWSFVTYVILATILKAVGLLHTYLMLIFTETFFVDWERPRNGVDRSRETTMLDISTNNDMNSQKPRRTIPIVIWRTYLIANEWNELQHYRKTSIALQLVLALFVLEWLQFSDYAILQSGFARGVNADEYAESRMSRFAVDITVYLSIALLQWLVTVIFTEKIVDPFRNFMDLCSVANISVLAFTHPLRAYYIHGRSIHGLADTDMLEMNMFLQREKENLCGLRGLESNSELQTFIACLPKNFREKLNDLTSTMRSGVRAVNMRTGNDKVTSKVETSAKVHSEMTQFIKDFIDHADPNCDYVVAETRFIEDLLDIELTDTSRVGSFIRDHSEMAYSSVFIYGNEWSHLSLELLLFAVIDITMHSRILSATIVYVVSTSIRTLSKSFFTNNLVKSSLVDHRFLI